MRVCKHCGALAGMHKYWCDGNPPTVTEAEQTIQRALRELRLQKGNGAWNLNQIQHILEQGTNERATT